MSNNRNSKNAHDKIFETYRQIAPESFSDESLRNLIKSKNNQSEEIIRAIENIWHDTPEKLAVGSEWVTTSKSSTKKPTPQPTRRVETGGRGGGRRSQPAGGRGNGERSRAEKSTSNTSLRPQKPVSPAPISATPIVAAAESVEVPVPSAAPVVASISVPSGPEETTSVETSKPAWGSGPSFAAKLKLAEAEKVKAAAALEEEKKSTAKTTQSATTGTAVEASETTGKRSTTPRTRARKSRPSSKKSEEAIAPENAEANTGVDEVDKVDALAAALQSGLAVDEGSSLSTLITEPVTAAPVEGAALDTAPGFLKLDKWDASAAGTVAEATATTATSSEMFQFGSFGSSFGAAASDADNKSSTTTWAASADTAVGVGQDAGVSSWASSDLPSANASSIGSLFSQKNTLDNSAAGGGVAPRPPPGLEQNTQAANNKQGGALRSAPGQQAKFNKETAQQQQQLLQMQQQSMLYGQQPLQQSYGQQQQLPPGISAPASTNRGGMPAAPASNLPYGAYSPTFDLSQPQFMHPQFNPAVSAALSLPGAAGASAPATGSAPGSSAASTAGAQQQQYAPAAPFPFYGNPYYGHQQAFFYGQPQVPNFYGQQGGRGPYQDQGLYGGNPYANQGSLYPPQQQQAGQQQQGQQQFGESSAAYGMGSSGAVGSNAQGVSKGAAGKGSAAGSNTASAGSQPTAGLQPQDLGMGNNYGGYNPYNQQRGMDPQAWQYQQNQPTPWGGPMMNFPAPPVGAGLLPNHQQQQGFTQAPQQSSHLGMNLSGQQQQGQQGQGANNQRNGPSANSTYGSSSFVGNRSTGGAGGSSTTGGVSQGW